MFLTLYCTDQTISVNEKQFQQALTGLSPFSGNAMNKSIDKLSDWRDFLSYRQKHEIIEKIQHKDIGCHTLLRLWDKMHDSLSEEDGSLLIDEIIAKLKTLHEGVLNEYLGILNTISDFLTPTQTIPFGTQMLVINALSPNGRQTVASKIVEDYESINKLYLDDALNNLKSSDLTLEQKSVLAAKVIKTNDMPRFKRVLELTQDSLNEQEKIALNDFNIKAESLSGRCLDNQINFHNDLTQLQQDKIIATMVASNINTKSLCCFWAKNYMNFSPKQKMLLLDKIITRLDSAESDALKNLLKILKENELTREQVRAMAAGIIKRDVLNDQQKHEILETIQNKEVYFYDLLRLWEKMHDSLSEEDGSLLMNMIIPKIKTLYLYGKMPNCDVYSSLDILVKIREVLTPAQSIPFATQMMAIHESTAKEMKPIISMIVENYETFNQLYLDDALKNLDRRNLTREQKRVFATKVSKVRYFHHFGRLWELTHDALNEKEKFELNDYIISKNPKMVGMPTDFYKALTPLQQDKLIAAITASNIESWPLLRFWENIRNEFLPHGTFFSLENKALVLDKIISRLDSTDSAFCWLLRSLKENQLTQAQMKAKHDKIISLLNSLAAPVLGECLEILNKGQLTQEQMNAMIVGIINNEKAKHSDLFYIWQMTRESTNDAEKSQLMDKIISKTTMFEYSDIQKVKTFISELNDQQKSALVDQIINSAVDIEQLSEIWPKIGHHFNQEDKKRLFNKTMEQIKLAKDTHNLPHLSRFRNMDPDDFKTLVFFIIKHNPQFNLDDLNEQCQDYSLSGFLSLIYKDNFLNFNQNYELLKIYSRDKTKVTEYLQNTFIKRMAQLYPNVKLNETREFLLNASPEILELIKEKLKPFYIALLAGRKKMRRAIVDLRYLRIKDRLPLDLLREVSQFLLAAEPDEVPPAVERIKKMPESTAESEVTENTPKQSDS